MKITHVIQDYEVALTGPGNHVKALVTKVKESKHQSTILTTHHKVSTISPRIKLENTTEIRSYYVVSKIMKYYFVKGLKKDLPNIQTDVFHVHSWRSQIADTTVKFAKRKNIPVVLQAHGTANAKAIAKMGNASPISELPYIAYDIFFKNSVVKTANIIIATTQQERKICIEYGCDPNKTRVIPLGINTSNYSLKKQSKDCEKLKLLMVGRLDRARNVEVLVNALAILKDRSPNFLCRIVGPEVKNAHANKSGYFSELKQLCQQLSLSDHVVFTGIKTGEALLKEYKNADIFIYPSSYENFGLPIIEAGAAGLAIIATNTGVVGDLIRHKTNGLILNDISAQELAKNLIYLFNNQHLIEEFGNRIQKECQYNYDISVVTKQYMQLYQELTNGKA